MSKPSDDSMQDIAKLDAWGKEKPVIDYTRGDTVMPKLITIMLRLIELIPGCRGGNIYRGGETTAAIFLPGYVWQEERLVRKDGEG